MRHGLARWKIASCISNTRRTDAVQWRSGGPLGARACCRQPAQLLILIWPLILIWLLILILLLIYRPLQRPSGGVAQGAGRSPFGVAEASGC